MSGAFFTIGHSNRPFDEFVELLRASAIELVVDVRKLPGSKRNPQFNEDALAESLQECGIRYRREGGLGGRRTVSRDVPDKVNGFWDNRSFHNYADYALSEEFGRALDRVHAWGVEHRLALMCSEAVWWRCHRRIVADHLLARGAEVRHIMSERRVEPARLTSGAEAHEDGRVTYPEEER